MTEEEIKELAKKYIDSCTTRAGFVILTEGIKSDFIDLFVAGFMKCLEQKATNPKWHKVADGDLPKNSDDETLYLVYWGENDYGVAQFNNSRWWSLDSGWYDAEDVIAWCEIKQYTEE